MSERRAVGLRAPRPATQLALAAGFGSALFSLLFQSPGVVLSPDGWAYWEGAVSLLRGEGYRYLDGPPLRAWPPGFSLYLALWQLALGNSAGTLAVAHATALGVASALWAAVALRAFAAERLRPAAIAAAGVVALLPPIALREVLSESLFMACLGAALLLATGPRPQPAPGRRDRSRPWLFAAALTALLLTRHAGAALVPALLWIYWRASSPRQGSRSGAWTLGPAAAGAFAVWLAVRAALGQVGQDRTIPLAADSLPRVLSNLTANLAAAAATLLPRSAWGLAATALLVVLLLLLAELRGSAPRARRHERRDSPLPGLAGGAVLAAILSAGMWAIYDVRGDRIVLPITALAVVALASASETAPRREARRLARALLLALVAIQVARVGYWIRHATRVEDVGVRWRSTLVAPCPPGQECQLAPGEVAPPPFPWIKRDPPRDAVAPPAD